MLTLITGVLIAIIALSVLVTGSLVLTRDTGKSRNRWFFLMSLFMGIWIPANFIDSNALGRNLVQVSLYIDLCVAPFIAWSFGGFVDTFNPRVATSSLRRLRQVSSLVKTGGFILNSLMAVLILAGLMVSVGVKDGQAEITYQPAFYAYGLVVLAYLSYTVAGLFIRKTHITHEAKGAIDAIFIGFVVAAFTNIFSNVISPLIFSERAVVKSLNIIGYAGFFVFILFIYFAITRRRLFDLKLVVARTLAYVLLGAALASIYAIVVFVIINHYISGVSVLTSQIVQLVTALVITITAPYFKRFFDRYTNKFFYKDSYDTKAFLGELNKIIVRDIDLKILLHEVSRVIGDNLKPDFTFFNLSETSYAPSRLIGRPTSEISTKDLKIMEDFITRQGERVIVIDDFADTEPSVYKIFRTNNVAVVARLVTEVDIASQGLGYLVLGSKRAGSAYSNQDIDIISIIASELVIAVQNALRFEEIEEFNVTLQQKVDDATRRLQRTNEKLKILDETKDEFISMASHQLRTPLTSVKGYLSMVLEGDAGKVSEQQHKLLQQAFTSSQLMVYLIADLLNLSRLRTGKFVIDSNPVNLADIISGELDQLHSTAAVRNLEISYDKPKDFPTLMLDETKIRQVIMNFSDNAIYYTPSGGHIVIGLKDKKDTIEFTVKDDGIGVPMAEQHHLFNKFYRAGNARKARPDGTGLGLFMAKKVIIASGGALIFKSAEGKGSTFGFTFAKKKLALPQTHVPAPTKTSS